MATEGNGSKNDGKEVKDEEDGEANCLLGERRGGMCRSPRKTLQKVQWNDRNGNKLAEVLEYQPSDVSDSDDEDSDFCNCTIM